MPSKLSYSQSQQLLTPVRENCTCMSYMLYLKYCFEKINAKVVRRFNNANYGEFHAVCLKSGRGLHNCEQALPLEVLSFVEKYCFRYVCCIFQEYQFILSFFLHSILDTIGLYLDMKTYYLLETFLLICMKSAITGGSSFFVHF